MLHIFVPSSAKRTTKQISVIEKLNKTSKFEWTLDNNRIEKIILAPIYAPIFFWRFQFYQMFDIVPSCNIVQYQGKLMMQPWENGKNPNFESNLRPPIFLNGFYLY